MPTVPRNQSADGGFAQIPDVPVPQSGNLLAYGAVGNGAQDLGRGIAGAAEIVFRNRDRAAREEAQRALNRDRAAREEAQRAITQYNTDLSTLWGGRPDPATGQASNGLRHLDPSDPDGASKRLAAFQRDWRDSKDGVYAKLSPEARKYFEPEAQAAYARFGALAVDHDYDARQTMRLRESEAVIASQTQMAKQFEMDGEKFAAAEAAASHAIAAAKVGPGLLNPEEKDPDKLRFAGASFKAQYAAERAAASETLRFNRAKTLADSAKLIGDDGMAGARLGVAQQIADGLNPELKTQIGEQIAEVEHYRKAVRRADELDRRRVADEKAAALDAAGESVRYRYFRGEIDAKTALQQSDKLFGMGYDGKKATDLRAFIEEREAKRADAAKASENTFAPVNKGDTSAYLSLQEMVLKGDAPWDTEDRLNAAARSGAIEEGQFQRLHDLNRKGMDEKTRRATRAALAAAADLDLATVDDAFGKDQAAAKAQKKLMAGLSYDYDRPWRIDAGARKLTAQEFDALVDSTKLFIEANPDKDPYKDHLLPLLKPSVNAARAQTMAERLAAERPLINAALDLNEKNRARRVGRMAAEYQTARGISK